MNKSEQINELAAALSKAQGEIKNAAKDALNPHFNRTYADLANVWDACREPLSKNGLAVLQAPEFRDGKVYVATVMMHSSGQWVEAELEMIPVKTDPQGVGSAITYARRYSLSGFAGIAPEDDDGNAASGKEANGQQQEKPKTTNKSPASTTIGAPALPQANATTLYITPKQLDRFHAIWQDRKWLEPNVKKLLKDFGVESSKYILKTDYDKIIGFIENGDYDSYLDFTTNPPAKAV